MRNCLRVWIFQRPRSVLGPAYGVKLEMRCTCRLVFGSGNVVSETTPTVESIQITDMRGSKREIVTERV
jgi:hypothetical protein